MANNPLPDYMAIYNAYTGGMGIATANSPVCGTAVGLPIFGGPPWENQYQNFDPFQAAQAREAQRLLALQQAQQGQFQRYYEELQRQAAAQNQPLPEPAPVIAQTPPPGPVHVNLDVSEPVEVAAPQLPKRTLDIDG